MLRLLAHLLHVIGLCLLLAASSRAEILELEPSEFREIALTGKALILDVRDTEGWNLGRIENSTYISNLATMLELFPVNLINYTLKEYGIFPCLEQCTTIGKYHLNNHFSI